MMAKSSGRVVAELLLERGQLYELRVMPYPYACPTEEERLACVAEIIDEAVAKFIDERGLGPEQEGRKS